MLVEDDSKIADIVLENIHRWGFQGFAVHNFTDVLSEFVASNPHLVLMDVNLPAYDGYYWCNKIRAISRVPIIFISARNTNMDIIMAVNMGGDDFVTKPFSLEVLMAKITALLRRTYSYIGTETSVIEHNNVILNLNDRTLTYHDTRMELTKNEFKILQVLMKSHGRVISREEMMKELWEDESFVDDNTLTVNVNRLRKKLKEIGLDDWIKTRKDQGYVVL